ncbi:MAG: serine/threonine-protein kinase [Myxococcota bacterium]
MSPYDRSTRECPSEELRDLALDDDKVSADADTLPPGCSVGRYAVLRPLGRGGMGVVYEAHDPQLARNVALKVLRKDRGHDPAIYEMKLLREAQTLARLQHPNIVTVYDAGLSAQGVFLAMELIDGRTLGQWLDERPRRPKEIVATLCEAGRGLAAAHRAGIVHRDFKPSNILVGRDGTVRVLDFGLAHLLDPGRVPPRRLPDPTEWMQTAKTTTRTTLEFPSCESGTLVGTPAYMAPEQLLRESVDERSDQYSFCLCLQLALGGPAPERGPAFEALGSLRIMPRPRPPAGPIPIRVQRVIERGLATDPAQRFASMDALLTELSERPKRWVGLGASMLMVGFGLGALMFDSMPPRACRNPERGLQGIWGVDDQHRVRLAFLGTSHPDAPELLERVSQQLDGYAGGLVRTYGAACQATHVDHQQSEQLFDEQMVCLRRHRGQLHEVVEALARVDSPKAMLDRMTLAFKLPTIQDCTDPLRLLARLPLPHDRAERKTVERLQQRLDHAQTLAATGSTAGALAITQEVLEQARTIDYPPVLAEALGSMGSLQASGSSARDAEATLIEAIRVATATGADEIAARAWTWLLYALTVQDRLEQGFTLQFAAEAAVERAGDPIARGWLLNNLGALYSKGDRPERGVEYVEQALAIKQQSLGADHFDVAISWFNLGTAQLARERFEDAREAYERALEGFERTLGQAHPLTHHAMAGLCEVEAARGNPRAAVALCEQVLEHLHLSPWSTVSMGVVRFFAAKALWEAGQDERARRMALRARAELETENPELTNKIEHWLDNHRPLALRRGE